MATVIDKQAISAARAKRVRILRNMLCMNLDEFATLVGLTKSTIARWESGQIKGLPDRAAREIVEVLSNTQVVCELDWLLKGTGVPPMIRSDNQDIALHQWEFIKLVEGRDQNTAVEPEIRSFVTFTTNAISMQVQDDSMEPVFQVGDYVAGVLLSKNELHQALGKMCIVQLPENKLLLRKVFKDDDKYKLVCLNTNSTTEPVSLGVTILGAAPVSRVWRKVYR